MPGMRQESPVCSVVLSVVPHTLAWTLPPTPGLEKHRHTGLTPNLLKMGLWGRDQAVCFRALPPVVLMRPQFDSHCSSIQACSLLGAASSGSLVCSEVSVHVLHGSADGKLRVEPSHCDSDRSRHSLTGTHAVPTTPLRGPCCDDRPLPRRRKLRPELIG